MICLGISTSCTLSQAVSAPSPNNKFYKVGTHSFEYELSWVQEHNKPESFQLSKYANFLFLLCFVLLTLSESFYNTKRVFFFNLLKDFSFVSTIPCFLKIKCYFCKRKKSFCIYNFLLKAKDFRQFFGAKNIL